LYNKSTKKTNNGFIKSVQKLGINTDCTNNIFYTDLFVLQVTILLFLYYQGMKPWLYNVCVLNSVGVISVHNHNSVTSEQNPIQSGFCTLVIQPGFCTLVKHSGFCTLVIQSGICTLIIQPGFCTLVIHSGICNLVIQPGFCILVIQPGFCILVIHTKTCLC